MWQFHHCHKTMGSELDWEFELLELILITYDSIYLNSHKYTTAPSLLSRPKVTSNQQIPITLRAGRVPLPPFEGKRLTPTRWSSAVLGVSPMSDCWTPLGGRPAYYLLLFPRLYFSRKPLYIRLLRLSPSLSLWLYPSLSPNQKLFSARQLDTLVMGFWAHRLGGRPLPSACSHRSQSSARTSGQAQFWTQRMVALAV